MRRALVLALALAACTREAPPSPPDASPVTTATASPATVASGPDGASATPPPSASEGSSSAMPPRPVPKTSPTVGSGMPAEIQMKAIGYMAAMAQPRFDDPPADAAYAEQLSERLRPIARSMDKGPEAERARLGRVDVAAGGRKIDILVAGGCDAEMPTRAVVTRAGVPLSTLLSHGVLVVRCNDARVQCLQSTRDPTDVLCTTAPRHK